MLVVGVGIDEDLDDGNHPQQRNRGETRAEAENSRIGIVNSCTMAMRAATAGSSRGTRYSSWNSRTAGRPAAPDVMTPVPEALRYSPAPLAIPWWITLSHR